MILIIQNDISIITSTIHRVFSSQMRLQKVDGLILNFDFFLRI
jgi:hypothetical protein